MRKTVDRQETLNRVRELGLLAVLRGPSPDLTLKMVDALIAGGVTGIEITYSTPDAAGVVRGLNERYGDAILLGMGTLTEPHHPAEAKAAGAQFIVSPHYDEVLAAAMRESGLAMMIGALTPAEIVQAYKSGSDIVKVFPGSLGGPKYMKALRGPFPDIPMMPTGGVSAENVAEWFAAGAVAVGAGSELCPRAWAEEGRFDDITERAREFAGVVASARSAT
jgi:2-dehydro-3-deoxyphosphogluconate aldolase/(4S)-4-hydroxy-2-oxoglutarate aldolase